DPLAEELDAAGVNLALLDPEDAGDRLEQGGLPGTVGAQDGDDGAGRHLDRHALQHQDDVLIDDLDVVDFQHGAPSARGDPATGGEAGPIRSPNGERPGFAVRADASYRCGPSNQSLTSWNLPPWTR